MQQSMVTVPRDTPGLTIVCDVPVFGHHDQHGHCEVELVDVRVPMTNLLGEEGAGFAMAQADITESRIANAQARLHCQQTAAVIDAHGNKAAAGLVSQAEVLVPRLALQVIDRAIRVQGGAGVSDDVPLTAMYGWHRAMRILDGPDEVHLRTIAKSELAAERERRLMSGRRTHLWSCERATKTVVEFLQATDDAAEVRLRIGGVAA